MYSPTDSLLMDAFDSWGFMLPGSAWMDQETWPQIVRAYHEHALVPDSRLPRKQFSRFANHPTGGVVPVDDDPVPPEGVKLFGLRGKDGVTAFFEKHPTKRGLVVYEPGKEPTWVGTRHFGIRSWTGPGVPANTGYRYYIRDWLIYDETSLLGLDPGVTYVFDETVEGSMTRFHVSKVPDDFAFRAPTSSTPPRVRPGTAWSSSTATRCCACLPESPRTRYRSTMRTSPPMPGSTCSWRSCRTTACAARRLTGWTRVLSWGRTRRATPRIAMLCGAGRLHNRLSGNVNDIFPVTAG